MDQMLFYRFIDKNQRVAGDSLLIGCDFRILAILEYCDFGIHNRPLLKLVYVSVYVPRVYLY